MKNDSLTHLDCCGKHQFSMNDVQKYALIFVYLLILMAIGTLNLLIPKSEKCM